MDSVDKYLMYGMKKKRLCCECDNIQECDWGRKWPSRVQVGPLQKTSPPKPSLLPCLDPAINVCSEHLRAVRPMWIVMLLYGIAPMTFNPVRVSLHPLRSTISYMVAVNLLVLWSTWCVVSTTPEELKMLQQGIKKDTSLFIFHCRLHVSAILILIMSWIEMPAHVRRMAAWGIMVRPYNALFRKMPASRSIHAAAWLCVFCCVVVVPTWIILFNRALDVQAPHWRRSMWEHVPAHVFYIILVIFTTSVFSLTCLIVRDMAAVLSTTLREEVAARTLSVSRVHELRAAWLCTSKLLDATGAMALSRILTFGYLLTSITFATYETLISISDISNLFVNNFVLLLIGSCITLLVMCDAAHRATAELNNFVQPLMTISSNDMSPNLRSECERLETFISRHPASLSLAGFFAVDRTTFLSIMAATVTYTIVMIQFQQTQGAMESDAKNMTAATGLDFL